MQTIPSEVAMKVVVIILAVCLLSVYCKLRKAEEWNRIAEEWERAEEEEEERERDGPGTQFDPEFDISEKDMKKDIKIARANDNDYIRADSFKDISDEDFQKMMDSNLNFKNAKSIRPQSEEL